ncbi:helix-turn-helix domain-containing protein [Kitasatospora sp. NPDC058965]|uniref:helix-turn-helix domain-containing protein n=1 Tax=Kitasatospora sp. NPDC058965 TaxID=3346682 RepID=UPI0036CDC6EC
MESAQDATTEIGRRLRDLRRERGLKQSDLAGEGMSVSYLSLLESGKRPVTPVILRRLATELGCTVEYLRTGEHSDRERERQRELLLRLTVAELALRDGEYPAALAGCEELLAEQPPPAAETVRRVRQARADALERLGRPVEALAELQALGREPNPGPGSVQWLRLAVARCRCHLLAGEPASAVETGTAALAALDEVFAGPTEDHLGLGVALIEAYHRAGLLAHARELADLLLPWAERGTTTAARAAAFREAGRRARAGGDTALALTLNERALALPAADELGRLCGLLKAGYGALLLDEPKPDPARARAYLVAAARELAGPGGPADRAGCELNLARVALLLDELAAAAGHAHRALELAGDGPTGVAVRAWLQLGEARWLQGRGIEAAEALARVEQLLGSGEHGLSSGRDLAEAWRALGDLWLGQGRSDSAMSAYRLGLAAAGLAGAAPLRAMARPIAS